MIFAGNRFRVLFLGACLVVAAPVFDADLLYSAATARDVMPRIWQALSGDTLQIEGEVIALSGVNCPAPGDVDGRDAKALLNTFLRDGLVECRVTAGGVATCSKDGRDVASGLIASGLCSVRPASGDDATIVRVLTRDSRPSIVAQSDVGRADACRAADPHVTFLDRARSAACDAGTPFSLCQGRNGLRQFGRPVARSDAFRDDGAGAPVYRPFACR